MHNLTKIDKMMSFHPVFINIVPDGISTNIEIYILYVEPRTITMFYFIHSIGALGDRIKILCYCIPFVYQTLLDISIVTRLDPMEFRLSRIYIMDT